MIVHFSTSSKNIIRRAGTIRLLMSHIQEAGHALSRDWINEATEATLVQKADIQRWKKISQETLQALKRSDAVVIEASIDSFSMGFQAALAIQLKKPLLILRSRSSYRQNGFIDVYDEAKPVEQSLLAGDTSTLSSVEVYKSTDDARVILQKFLNDNNLDKTDMRFNMFLDRESYQYLEYVSQQTGKTKAKVVRDMLKEKNRE